MNKSLVGFALVCALAGPALAAPTVSITGKPSNPSTSTSATFTFAGTNASSYNCRLTSSTGLYHSLGACTSPATYTGLPNENYYFQVDALDANGATATDYYAFVVNAPQPPTVTLTSTPAATVSVANISYSFTGTSVSSYTCTLRRSADNSIVSTGACTSPKAYSGLANGGYTFQLEGTASNGAKASASHSVTVNVPNPALPAISSFKATPSSLLSGQSTTLSWSVSNATSLTLTNVGSVTGRTSATVTPTASTVYTLTATNAAGSTTATTSVAVTVTTPPQNNNALSNPVTSALTGSHATYHVGPGKAYPTPDTVPWTSLVAGDVVNIYYNATAYKYKLCLTGVGTRANPIIINGVTDGAGNRPKFDFNGARTASTCGSGTHPAFPVSDPWGAESLGGITILRGTDAGAPTPAWIQIRNLEVYNALNGNSYTSFTGSTRSYASSAGLYVHVGNDILLENNVVYNNGFGIFSMAKNDTLDYAVQRLTVRNSRVYLNGVPNSYYEHNFYVQSTNPVIEGNYIGQTIAGSQGSAYKSRASGELFRYNYVESGARVLDLVHSEEQTNGIMAQADYGTDYVYGNILVSDYLVSRGGGVPVVHYGGDNRGEEGRLGDASPVLPSTIKYRSHLYFFNNTVYLNANVYRTSIFDLSLIDTTLDAWNNIIVAKGSYNGSPTLMSWVRYAGVLNLRGNNLVTGVPYSYDENADPAKVHINKLGTLIGTDPKFVDLKSYNFNLQSASPALDKATLPSGLPASLAGLKVVNQPQHKTNGLVTRPVNGAASDLGALER